MSVFQDKYDGYLNYFNEKLQEFCDGLKCRPQILTDSLKYSLLLGGKRIRPVIMYAIGDVLGVDRQELNNFALALELIHTYSLVHDDLPDMDNDDFRRGKPSNHKVFGANNAILAGDGLLNTAYSILLGECFKGSDRISASKFICDCAGIYGMIAGQSADLMYENNQSKDENALEYIYENKTGKLITAALVVPSVLSGGKYYSELKKLGSSLGYLFQLTDDILDVEGNFENLGKSVGKDEKEQKFTSVKLYGLEKSKLKADIICDACHGILEGINGDVSFIQDLINYVRLRAN